MTQPERVADSKLADLSRIGLAELGASKDPTLLRAVAVLLDSTRSTARVYAYDSQSESMAAACSGESPETETGDGLPRPLPAQEADMPGI
ncbi:hypothetical protein ACIBCS_19815 [Streptomyces phaeochromogenes]|uniref:hypothetical protein n=1 Tax=Streptomyces phaeochromogenes TaxID=1923 RepID=UPI003410E6CB